MKKLSIILLFFCVTGCALAQSDRNAEANSLKYDVSGTWEGGDGQYVYIRIEEGIGVNRRIEVIDSALVENGRFRMSKPLPDNFAEVAFHAGGVSKTFIFGKTPVIVTCTEIERIRNGIVTKQMQIVLDGGPEQEVYRTYVDARSAESVMMFGLAMGERSPEVSAGRRDTMAQLLHTRQEFNRHLFDSLATSNPDMAVTAFIIEGQANNFGLERIEDMYNNLTPYAKSTFFGRKLEATIGRMKKVEQGAQASEFRLTTSNNNIVTLSDYRGKYVLLSFWGSWCAPCRRSHPKLIELYTKYKDEGFEILGLANERSTDEVWRKAIEDDGLLWRQVNLTANETGAEVLNNYNVYAFPTKILIGPNGKIIVTYVGASGELETILEEIFGK